jgi:hypothetical protein
VVGQEGLTYHLRQVGALAAGDTREWTFSYVKTDTALTAASLAPAPTATPTAAGGTGDSTVWIFMVAFVALIAVGATGFWLGNRAQPAPVPAARQPQKRRGSGRGERPRQMPARRGSATSAGPSCALIQPSVTCAVPRCAAGERAPE